ncbi:MAG: hypothetical protein HZA36_00140 [Parcubacteria group bacterium]|nr:hypothetical protein [Parcubacteria group bacterium]
MSNPQLNETQLKQAHRLIAKVRKWIETLAKNNPEAIFAFRRKIYKELMYDERSKPMERKRLKDKMWKKQNGICPLCRQRLPEKGAVLDRIKAIGGYKEGNVRLICASCDGKVQEERGYK